MIQTRQLEALRAVAETGSVARAGAVLQWSQPTVVHHLRALETEIGASVVAASSAGTSLTPVGERLLPHALAIIDRLHRASRDVRAFADNGRTRLSFGVFPTLAALVLPSLVTELRSQGIELRAREAEVDVLRTEVQDLRLDAALVYTSAQAENFAAGLTSQRLFSEPLVLLCSSEHPGAGSEDVSLLDFEGDRWILGAHSGEPIEAFIRSSLASGGRSPAVFARSDDYRVVASYVAANLGVAVVPISALNPEIPGVHGLRISSPGAVRHVHLISNPGVPKSTTSILTTAVLAAHRAARRD